MSYFKLNCFLTKKEREKGDGEKVVTKKMELRQEKKKKAYKFTIGPISIQQESKIIVQSFSFFFFFSIIVKRRIE